MKSKFLLVLVSIVAMLASCNKNETEGTDVTPKSTRFTLNVDNGAKTRAVVTDLTRYVMELYKGTTATGEPVFHKEQATATFENIVLDNNTDYVALFWADYGTPNGTGNEYDVTSLLSAKVAKQPTAAAFSGVSAFRVDGIAEANYPVTLKHSVAMVNFVQAEALTAATNTLVVNYPASYSLNVETNEATEIAGAVSHTFTYNKKEVGTLGTSYIIASGTTTKTVMEVTTTLNGETAKLISNVPFQRNFKTNIKGAYSNLYDAAMTVTCEDAFSTPENDAEFGPKDFIEVNGIKVAVGNLIADGATKCKIGAPEDGGLYFQFGSLIGWNGSREIAVKPDGCSTTLWNPSWTGDPTANDATTGFGDPCRYYLKDDWRLPTRAELNALFGQEATYSSELYWTSDVTAATGWETGGGFDSTTPGYAMNTKGKNLKFWASGGLNINGVLDNFGKNGNCWSVNILDNSDGYCMSFYFDKVLPGSGNNRASGYPIRCVR